MFLVRFFQLLAISVVSVCCGLVNLGRTRVVLLKFSSSAIGHLATEPLYFWFYFNEHKKVKGNKTQIIFVPDSEIANKFLFNLWVREFKALLMPSWVFGPRRDPIFLEAWAKVTPESPLRRFPSIYWGKNGYARELPKRGPVGISSYAFESQSSELAVGTFVVPKRRKVALLCARDAAYSSSKNTADENIKSLRNCNIQTYEGAAQFLLQRDYFVIRMGSRTARRMSVDNPKFLDYSSCDHKSDELDIKLFQSAEIVISSNYGLDHLAFLFGSALLYTNQYYLLNLEFLAYIPKLRFIMKHPLDYASHKVLKLTELARRAPTGIWDDKIVSNARVVLRDNNAHEILTATQELLQIKNSTNLTDESSSLTPRQILFWQNYQEATEISIDFARLSSAPSEVFLTQNSFWLE